MDYGVCYVSCKAIVFPSRKLLLDLRRAGNGPIYYWIKYIIQNIFGEEKDI
jgi:hypothetical protein